MPPRMPRLDGEEDVRPGEVEMDDLARGQLQWMLSLRFRKTGATDRAEDIELEPALARRLAVRSLVQPPLEAADPATSLTAVGLEKH
jgi:hypothetical protein